MKKSMHIQSAISDLDGEPNCNLITGHLEYLVAEWKGLILWSGDLKTQTDDLKLELLIADELCHI